MNRKYLLFCKQSDTTLYWKWERRCIVIYVTERKGKRKKKERKNKPCLNLISDNRYFWRNVTLESDGDSSWHQILLQMFSSLLVFEFSESTWLNLSNSFPTYTHYFSYFLQCFHPAIFHPKPPSNYLSLSWIKGVEYLFEILLHELFYQKIFWSFRFGVGNDFLEMSMRIK